MVSADGHPVGGALVFSIGAPSAQPPSGAQPAADPAVRTALWAAKLVIYLGLAVGIGGAFFRAWIAAPDRRAVPLGQADPWIVTALIAGLAATALSVGLQGLDALELSLREIGTPRGLGNRARNRLRPDGDRGGVRAVRRGVRERRDLAAPQPRAVAPRARRRSASHWR